MKPEDYTKYFEAAEKYNKKLAKNPSAFYNPDEIKGYEKILDISGTGIMGYITIKKLGVELPIYHGTVLFLPTVGCRAQSFLQTSIKWK